jgi:hypothetical protein
MADFHDAGGIRYIPPSDKEPPAGTRVKIPTPSGLVDATMVGKYVVPDKKDNNGS